MLLAAVKCNLSERPFPKPSETSPAITVTCSSSGCQYRNFLSDHHVVVGTHRDPSRRISKSFGTYMFPETCLIQDGRIVRKVVGGIDWMSDDIASFMRTRLARH